MIRSIRPARSAHPDQRRIQTGPNILVLLTHSKIWTSVLSAGLVLSLMLAVDGCNPRTDPRWTTRVQIRRIHGAVGQFRHVQGRLPRRLEEICESGVDPCLLAPERWATDRWGHRILLTPTDSADYELRSLGPDGKPQTSDDLVFSSSAERAAVRRFAGCYAATLPEWHGERLDTIVLSQSPIQGGAYELRPAFSGYRSSWAPFDEDSILAIWTDGFSGMGLLAEVVDDKLRGLTSQFTDMDLLPNGKTRFSAHRVTCADS